MTGDDDRTVERTRFRVGNILGRNVDDGTFSTLMRLIAGPYVRRLEAADERARQNAAERRALSRKANQRVDVIAHGDLSLVEIAEIIHLRGEGLKPAKIAALFEVPTATIRDIFDAFDGKRSDAVLYRAELRRRRMLAAKPVDGKGRRAVDTDSEPENVVHEGEDSSAVSIRLAR